MSSFFKLYDFFKLTASFLISTVSCLSWIELLLDCFFNFGDKGSFIFLCNSYFSGTTATLFILAPFPFCSTLGGKSSLDKLLDGLLPNSFLISEFIFLASSTFFLIYCAKLEAALLFILCFSRIPTLLSSFLMLVSVFSSIFAFSFFSEESLLITTAFFYLFPLISNYFFWGLINFTYLLASRTVLANFYFFNYFFFASMFLFNWLRSRDLLEIFGGFGVDYARGSPSPILLV